MDKATSAGTNQQPENHYSTAGESHDLLQKSDLLPLARTVSVRICVEVIPMQIGTQIPIYIALHNASAVCTASPYLSQLGTIRSYVALPSADRMVSIGRMHHLPLPELLDQRMGFLINNGQHDKRGDG